MTDKEVMQMALDCLLAFEKEDYFRWSKEDNACVAALRTALAQPEKEWVGLTDKEIEDCLEMSIQGTCRTIEAKLKDKNT